MHCSDTDNPNPNNPTKAIYIKERIGLKKGEIWRVKSLTIVLI